MTSPSNHASPNPVITSGRSSRGAFTLVELCMVIAVTALIASLASTMLYAIVRQQAAGGRQLLVANSLLRLGDRFRQDVWTALEVRITDGEKITLVQPGDVIVSYQTHSIGTIRRTWHHGNELRQDDFDMQAEHELSFAVDADLDSTEMVTLSVQPVAADQRSSTTMDARYVVSSRGTKIVAQLGRDHRWHDIQSAENSDRPKENE